MRRLRLQTTSDTPTSKPRRTLVRSTGFRQPDLERVFSSTAAASSDRRRGSGRWVIRARVRLWPQTWRYPLKHWTTLAAAGLIAAAAFGTANAADISGAGATF